MRMPFARPTLAELVVRIRSDIRGRLSIASPLLRRALADVLGTVWAGAIHLLYGYLDWIFAQAFADTSAREQFLRIAALFGITPTPATYGTFTVTATGTNGTAIPVDTILRLDADISYRVTTGQVIAGGTATLPVTAVLAGADSNVEVGQALTFESPIAGVNAGAVVASVVDEGEDEESLEEVRDRFFVRIRKKPTGGSDADYEGWALAVAGVTRAWVYRNENGLGTVVVRFVRDSDVSIIPDAGEVAAVQTKFNSERAITDEPTAMAPTASPVAFTIHVVPDNADTRIAVTAELTDLLKRDAEPGDGAGRGTIKLSKMRTAIGVAEDVTDYALTVPAADVVPGVGQLPVLGVITWV